MWNSMEFDTSGKVCLFWWLRRTSLLIDGELTLLLGERTWTERVACGVCVSVFFLFGEDELISSFQRKKKKQRFQTIAEWMTLAWEFY